MSSRAPTIAAENHRADREELAAQGELAAHASPRLGRSSHAADDEHYAALLRGLPWPNGNGDEPLKTLGFTSCRGGEGVSTVAARLAATAAQLSDRSVLLVDANLARPAVERLFELPCGVGLSDVLLENCELPAAIRSTRVARLRVLSAGQSAAHLDEVHDSARMAAMVASLKNEFELVVFDLPPAGEVVSAASLAGLLDGVVLVIEARRTRWEAAQRVTQQLSRTRARLLGAVLNKRV